MQQNSESILTVEKKGRITFSGVESVDAFSDTGIRLTAAGQKVKIEGSKLKVLSFSEGSGNFTASGEVTSIKYGGGGLKKLFK